jgi:hypothetical protein
MSGKENILYAGSNTSECYCSSFSIEGIFPDGLKRHLKSLISDLSEANKPLITLIFRSDAEQATAAEKGNKEWLK